MWKYTGIKECNDFLLSLHLFDYEDEKKYIKTLYTISNRIEKNYKVYKIKKHNGKFRTIHEPNVLLKQIQRRILLYILNNKAISKYATAYHRGACLKDNAIPHRNQEIVLKLDIKDFFENISFIDVYNSCFPIEYFPKSVGMLLSYLCTYEDYLIQGAPTSAYISNLVMRTFDESLGAWCSMHAISYTRYSDDMTFSGTFTSSEVIEKVRELLKPLGLEINRDKIHVIHRSSCQNVTGVVVNDKVQVSVKYRKKIRQEVYYIKKYGLRSHMQRCGILGDSVAYLNSLYGRVLYVLQINEQDKDFQEYKIFIKELLSN